MVAKSRVHASADSDNQDTGATGADLACAGLANLPTEDIPEAVASWLRDATADDVFGLIEAAARDASEGARRIAETLSQSPGIPAHLRMMAEIEAARRLRPSAKAARAQNELSEAKTQLRQILAIRDIVECRDLSSIELLRRVRPRSRFIRDMLRLAIVALERGAQEVIAEYRRKPKVGSPHVSVLIPLAADDRLVQDFLVTDLLLSPDDELVDQAIGAFGGVAIPVDVLGERGIEVLLSVAGGARRLRVGRLDMLAMGTTRQCAVEELADALREGTFRVEERLQEIAARLDRKNDDDAAVRRKIQRVLADVNHHREAAHALSIEVAD